MPVFCINCKHYYRKTYPGFYIDIMQDRCRRAVVTVHSSPDLITGEEKTYETGELWARAERTNADEKSCGEEGKYFEPKEKPLVEELKYIPHIEGDKLTEVMFFSGC